MARYIDAEPLPHGSLWDSYTHKEKAKILAWILSQPTADVVEVVRCKDCKKRGTFDCVKSKGDYPTTTKHNEYCCWGERRDT